MLEKDNILLDRIKSQSDEKAFEYLFHTYYNSLCKYAYGILHSHAEAEDVVSDCFFEFWNKRKLITIKDSLRSYLFVSVRNTSLNHLKRQKTKIKFKKDQQAQLKYPFFLHDDVVKQIEELQQMEEFESRLKKAINRLPKQCHYIFYLNRFEQLSYQEIATKLNLSVGTVKTQIARALKKIRAEFEDVKALRKILLYILVRH